MVNDEAAVANRVAMPWTKPLIAMLVAPTVGHSATTMRKVGLSVQMSVINSLDVWVLPHLRQMGIAGVCVAAAATWTLASFIAIRRLLLSVSSLQATSRSRCFCA